MKSLKIVNPADGSALAEVPADDAAQRRRQGCPRARRTAGLERTAARRAHRRASPRFRAARGRRARDAGQDADAGSRQAARAVAQRAQRLSRPDRLLPRRGGRGRPRPRPCSTTPPSPSASTTTRSASSPTSRPGTTRTSSAATSSCRRCSPATPSSTSRRSSRPSPGQHIDRLLHGAGVPADVFITLVGAGEVGAALLEQQRRRRLLHRLGRDRREDRRADGRRAWCGCSSSSAARTRPTSPTTPTRRRRPSRWPTAPCTTPARAAARSSASTCTRRCTTPSSTHFLATVAGFKAGDPLADGTYIGPLTRAPQLAVLEDQVADARRQGRDPARRRQARRARRQLVRADRAHRGRPHDGRDARRELRADHRHPEGRRRRRGAGA